MVSTTHRKTKQPATARNQIPRPPKPAASDPQENVELVRPVQPLIVDWKGLQAMGWPYSRQHTWRLMAANKSPKAHKLGVDLAAHPVWRVAEILAWFESCGLTVTEDWNRQDKS
jgi:predicted DNA-binding transcriptional regulator AlpA